MPGLDELRRWRYAHRGLHKEERPENSMAAFRAALEGGYGIEFDLHLLKDGNIAVIHDSDLSRVTGQAGIVEDLVTADLASFRLKGTEETIPQFRQVLELFNGKAPLIIELKTYKGNYAALAEAACQMLEGYNGPYCIESFDPYAVYWLKQNRPDIIRGQLSENFLRSKNSNSRIVNFIGTYCMENFLTKPDFLAYEYGARNNLSVFLCRKLWKLQGVSWTIRTPEQLETAEAEGWIPIFERFVPENHSKDAEGNFNVFPIGLSLREVAHTSPR